MDTRIRSGVRPPLPPNFWSVWVSGYADTQWSSTTPPPNFWSVWVSGYADTQWSSTTPPPNFWSVWVSGYADTQWSSTTPPPEFLECVGEWIRGYAVEFDHPSPRIFGVCGWVDTRIRSGVRPPLPPNFWSVWVSGYADTQWSSTTPPPNFWSVWVSGYADTQWSSTTPPPEFLECVGEWIRGYAVEFDHPSPEFLECVGEWIRGYAVKFDHPSPEFLECVGEWIRGSADTQWSSTTPPLDKMGFARRFLSGNRQEVNSTWYPEIEEPIKSREKHYSLVLCILIWDSCGKSVTFGVTQGIRNCTYTSFSLLFAWRPPIFFRWSDFLSKTLRYIKNKKILNVRTSSKTRFSTPSRADILVFAANVLNRALKNRAWASLQTITHLHCYQFFPFCTLMMRIHARLMINPLVNRLSQLHLLCNMINVVKTFGRFAHLALQLKSYFQNPNPCSRKYDNHGLWSIKYHKFFYTFCNRTTIFLTTVIMGSF